MLHITNGDSVASSLRASGLPGEVLAWRDVLHEGPVLGNLPLAALSQVRAEFIARAGWGRYDDVIASFRARDAALAAYEAHDEVVLWFEHDLYDQLQLIQILDWLNTRPPSATRLSLLCVGDYSVAPRFIGLGQLTPEQLSSLFPARHSMTPDELALGSAAWAAVRAPDPTALAGLLASDTSALPFLAGALTRLLEEYPAVGDGLSRTERQILAAVAAGADTPPRLFTATQNLEERPFMGDRPFWTHVHALGDGAQPLLMLADGGRFSLSDAHGASADFAAQRLALTDMGRAVLAGHADWAGLHPSDRWIGGVHLIGSAPAWRWDRDHHRLQHL